MKRYSIVALDPPWDIDMGPPMNARWAKQQLPYDTMSDDHIAALPIRDRLLDDAWVVLWVAQGRIEAAPRIMRGWGCRVIGWRCWHKTNGGPQLPNRWCGNVEFMLVGSVGRPKWTTTKGFRAVVSAPRVTLDMVDTAAYQAYAAECRASKATCPPPRFVHSAKPRAVYDDLKSRTDAPRLDMFARRPHPGWDGWGDQYGSHAA